MRGAAQLVEKTKENLSARKAEKKDKPPSVKRPLSEREAEDLKETYHQALAGIFELTDQGIKYTSGGHEDVQIWSGIDDADIAIIVEHRLRAARHSVRAARGVQRTIWFWENINVGMILIPRFWATWAFYADHGFDVPLKLRRRRKLKAVSA